MGKKKPFTYKFVKGEAAKVRKVRDFIQNEMKDEQFHMAQWVSKIDNELSLYEKVNVADPVQSFDCGTATCIKGAAIFALEIDLIEDITLMMALVHVSSAVPSLDFDQVIHAYAWPKFYKKLYNLSPAYRKPAGVKLLNKMLKDGGIRW